MKISRAVAAALSIWPAMTVYAQDELSDTSISASAEEGALVAERGVPDTIGERFYVAPMASYVLTDPDRGTDDGLGATLMLGKMFQSRFGVELELHYSGYDAEDGGETAKLGSAGVRGLLFPIERGGAFVTGGLSYGRFKDHPGNDADYETTLWTVGGGYMFGPFDLLLPDVAVRTELVFRGDMHDGDKTSETFNNALNELVASVGLMIPLGSVPAPPAPPPEPPVEVVAVAAPVDSDGDGVADDLDKCPDTPAGTAVDADGCPLPAPAPECKTPEPGQPITLEGCAAGDKIVLRGVNFEFDRAQLTANAKTILDGVAEALNSAPNVRVEVGGHTDGKGADEYNQKLSDRRAASVLQYLIGKGIDAGRMESRGYGESEPVADNETDEGRELNRRVELKIIE